MNSFYEKMDIITSVMPNCDMVLNDGFDTGSPLCPNKAVGDCPNCNKKVCYYHIGNHRCNI